jgi:hypothetical protein
MSDRAVSSTFKRCIFYSVGTLWSSKSSPLSDCISASSFILLTLLGYIPGIVHAVWIIAKR